MSDADPAVNHPAAPDADAAVSDPDVRDAGPVGTHRPAGPVFGPNAAAILATEHWSLLATRSLVWNEAMSRTAVFLTALSAAIVALALTADATDAGPTFATFALLLLPALLLLGLATYVRLVQLNDEDIFVVVAMNRLRRAYLDLSPELAPYFTTGATDDDAGLLRTLGLGRPVRATPVNFLLTTPTIVMTIDAALVAGLGALLLARLGASSRVVTVVATALFVVGWGSLFTVQTRRLATFQRSRRVRFPSPGS